MDRSGMRMSECFGCKHLKFNDIDPAFGYWTCEMGPGSREQPFPMVGKIGLLHGELVREPPKQVCNGGYQ